MKKAELFFTALLVPLDYAALLLAGVLTYALRFRSSFAEIRPVIEHIPFEGYLFLMAVIAALWIPIFAFMGLYVTRGTRRIVDEFRNVFVACSIGILGVIIFIFFHRELFASRFIVLAGWGIAILIVFVERLIVLLVERSLFRQGIGAHALALVGGESMLQDLDRAFAERPAYGYAVVLKRDRVDDALFDELTKLRRMRHLDEVLYGEPKIDDAALKLLTWCEEHHVVFKYIADIFATHARNIEVTTVEGIPIVEVRRTALDGWGRIWKRGFDVVISFFLIILFSPLMALVACMIALTSGRPIFFSRLDDGSPLKRIGEGGYSFHYFKFRSMVPGKHTLRYSGSLGKNLREGSPLVKIDHDPRITSFGRFLRRFSLDELPELFLVLKGVMSLVGPRPHLKEEVERYARHHKKVLAVKPGITGLAQISGRSDLDFEEEVRLDTYYVENWSPWLDFYILLKTPFAVIGKRKAE